MCAISGRSAFGRNLIAEQWAVAECAALGRLWTVGAPVPYPVQREGTELLLEFLGDEDGTAAPRPARTRPAPEELRELWGQLVGAPELFASQGLTHGDLSAYNILVHDGHLMVIDLPQVVDHVANPGGPEFLAATCAPSRLVRRPGCSRPLPRGRRADHAAAPRRGPQARPGRNETVRSGVIHNR
jgi:RIO kinase 1